MSALLSLINQLAQWISPVFYKLVYLSLTALPVGIIVALVRKIWDKRISPIWKYCMWMVFILALIVPWRLQSTASLTGSVQQVAQVSYRQEYSTAHAQTTHSAASEPVVFEQAQQQEQHLLVKSIIFDIALPLIWFFGTLVWLAILLHTQRQFFCRVRAATVEQSAFSPLAAQCRKLLGIRRSIPVVVQNYVTSPAIAGMIHPRILLPTCAHQMPADTLRFVLLHELGHYKRRDLWINQLLLILQCVYWFNPFIWWCAQPIRQDLELMNDSWLLKRLGPEQWAPYSHSLVEVLGLTRRGSLSARMVMMADGSKNTERRIVMMRSYKRFRKHRFTIGLCCLGLIGALCIFFLTSKPTAPSFQEAADALVNSIQAKDGTITFTIPQNGPAADDWSIAINGRSETPDGMGMSLHFLEQETWEPGKLYTIDPGEAKLTELRLYLSLPEGIERDVDLLAYLFASASSAAPDSEKAPLYNLSGYTNFMLSDPDQEPGNYAFTGKLTEEEQKNLFHLLNTTSWEEISSPEYGLTELLLLTDDQGHTLHLDYADLNDRYHILVSHQESPHALAKTWKLTADVSSIEDIQRSVLARCTPQPPSDSTTGVQMPAYLMYSAQYVDTQLEVAGISHEIVYQKNDRQWMPGLVVDAKLKSGQSLKEGSIIDPGQTVVLYVSDQQPNAGQLGADEHAELDFLTNEQRTLYQQACDSTHWIIAQPSNLTSCRGNRCGETVQSDSLYDFYLIEGPDHDYEKFCQDMLKLYTPHALDLLHFDERFINHNGQLAVSSGGYGGNIYLSNQPDTYIPVQQNDQEVVFYLVGHYIDTKPGESTDAFMERRNQLGFDWAEKYTIRMVNTADGWRLDEFHSTSF